MFRKHPFEVQKHLKLGDPGQPGVGRVPHKDGYFVGHPAAGIPLTKERRQALEELRKRGDRKAMKSRLAFFVYQKLINHFGAVHKKIIHACVEAYFVVKDKFTTEDIVGLEVVIRESIKNSQQQGFKQQHKGDGGNNNLLPEVSPTSKTKDTKSSHQPSHVRPGNEWQALQALRVAEEERREQNELARVKELERKRREQLDDQMHDFKIEKEKQRQEWMQEVLKGQADREKLAKDLELQKRKEIAKRQEAKQQHLEDLHEKKQRLEHEKVLQQNEDLRLARLAEEKYREQEKVSSEQDQRRAQSNHHPHPSSKAAPVPDKENFPHWLNQDGGGGVMNNNQQRQGKQSTGTGGTTTATAAAGGKVLRYGVGGQMGANVGSSSPTRIGTVPGQVQGLGLPKSALRESRSAGAGMSDWNHGTGGLPNNGTGTGTGTGGAPRGHTAKSTRTAAVDDRYHAALMRKNVRAVALENALLREEKNQRLLAEKKQAYFDAQREEQKIAISLQQAQQEQKHIQMEHQKQYRAVLRDQIDAKQRAKSESEGMSFVEKGMNKPALIKIGASDNNGKQSGNGPHSFLIITTASIVMIVSSLLYFLSSWLSLHCCLVSVVSSLLSLLPLLTNNFSYNRSTIREKYQISSWSSFSIETILRRSSTDKKE